MENISNSRRNFLKISGLTTLGLSLGISAMGKDGIIKKMTPAIVNLEINPFIVIDTAGNITLMNSRPDMGQGSTQAVPAMLAEELEVDLEKVNVQLTDGTKKYGAQLSGGSSTVRGLWLPIRKAGAAAKEMLIEAASKKWQVSSSDCYAQNAKVYHKPSGKSFTYGELADDASKLPIPKEPKLKDPKDFKILTKITKRHDVPMRVTGKAVFGIDMEVPNMLYASIERCPTIHGKVVSFDDSAALKVKGVKKVLKCERAMPHTTVEAVAVIADNYWAALKGRKLLKIKWDNGDLEKTQTTNRYFEEARSMASKQGAIFEKTGDFDAVFANSPKKLETIYETPFLAHAPLEPLNATASYNEDGSIEVWAPVQGTDGAIGSVSGYMKIAPEKVKINGTLMGGAFGRKAYLDYVNEACFLSKAIKAPVKLIWTREDDMSSGAFRPGMVSAMQGAIDKDGHAVGFHHHVIGESIQRQVFKANIDGKADDWSDDSINHNDSPYAFPNVKLSYHNVKTDIPILWWRSVYASNNGFGHESFIDEMAHATGKDPLDFRLSLLPDTAPRHRKVLELLREKAKYDEKLPAGQARGIAMCRSFETIAAHCITVSKQGNGVKIEKVVTVIDCGLHVNPDNVKAQTEGNIVMGLTAAIKDGITFTNGKCDQTNFHQYNILRLNEMVPIVEIHIAPPSQENPGGVGEPGLPPVAPALCNAIFNATGKRIKKLPFDINNIV